MGPRGAVGAPSRRWASAATRPRRTTLWDQGGREAIAEYLRELADARLDAKEPEVGETDWAQVERLVLVRTIDSLWVEHLTELDDMRRGIGLRGYAQQDPLNEFRREAFRLYEELRGLIRHGVASSIFRVTVQRQPPPGEADGALARSLAQGAAALRGPGPTGGQRRPGPTGPPPAAAGRRGRGRLGGRARLAARGAGGPQHPRVARRCSRAVAGGGNGAGARRARRRLRRPRPGYTPTGARIGRNDPCWCGSGAKYKKCHGR